MYTDLPIRLSLQECVRLLQINPAHFCSATADPVAFSPCSPACDDFWAERNWTGSPMSRDSLARAILQAEIDVEKAVDKPLTPKPRTRSYDAPDARDPRSGYSYVVGEHLAGYRPYKAQFLTTCAVITEDRDEDSLYETAVITFDEPENFDPATLVFYAGGQFDRSGARIWPPRIVEVIEGTVRVEFDCWQIIDRRYMLIPVLRIINLLDNESYLWEIEVGVMVEDHSEPQVVFIYDEPTITCGRPDCTKCTERVAYGVLESVGNIATAWPAKWDETTLTWLRSNEPGECSCIRFPKVLHITTYRSFCPPTPRDELCDPIKWIVALLAGARVQVGACECDCATSAWFRSLQADQANRFGTRYMSVDTIGYPFGTRLGEYQAYNAIRSSIGLVVRHATV